MKIVCEELDGLNNLTQDFTIPKSIMVGGIRIYVYAHNTPSGNFQLAIKDGATTIATFSFTASQVQTAFNTTDDYFHGWHSLDMGDFVSLNAGTYTFELSDTSGYTFSDSSFLGWVKIFENRPFPINYTISSFTDCPFGLEIWSYRK